jgi:hypothetical protein
MLANAALFVFGALQHAGVAIGLLREPKIIPAAIVETLCALVLVWGGLAKARRAALTGNLVAITGIAIGMVALALGAGPRTASNDIYHVMMMLLATAALSVLAMGGGGDGA